VTPPQAESLGTTEETPGRHLHFHIDLNSAIASMYKQQPSILVESPVLPTIARSIIAENGGVLTAAAIYTIKGSG
jgi:hypothetical protein